MKKVGIFSRALDLGGILDDDKPMLRGETFNSFNNSVSKCGLSCARAADNQDVVPVYNGGFNDIFLAFTHNPSFDVLSQSEDFRCLQTDGEHRSRDNWRDESFETGEPALLIAV